MKGSVENRQTEYLRFEFEGLTPSGKTEVYAVKSRSDVVLGLIRWHGAWRQYVFAPSARYETIFNRGCLGDIQRFLSDLMEARR